MNFEVLVLIPIETNQLCQQQATQSINAYLVGRNWLFGCYIVEFEQQGDDRAQYGARLLNNLANRLKNQGIKSCSVSNLRNFRQFYQVYPQIRQALPGEFRNISLQYQISQNFHQAAQEIL
jgi:hypothetical protein